MSCLRKSWTPGRPSVRGRLSRPGRPLARRFPTVRDGELNRIRRAFDRKAPGYDAGMRRSERKLGRWRARLVGDLEGRVLEIGIGTGATLPHYGASVQLTSIDLSPEMLRQAHLRAESLGMAVDLQTMDAQSLALDGASFDAVVFALSLCTIPDARAALLEAVRVALPGCPVR